MVYIEVYPRFGAEGPFLLDDGGIQTDHPRHPLEETVLVLHPTAVHAVTKNPKVKVKLISISSAFYLQHVNMHSLLLIILNSRALLHGGVVRDGVRTLFVQVSQDQLSHLWVLLPDARGHHGNGKSSLEVRRHLLLSLFLGDENVAIVSSMQMIAPSSRASGCGLTTNFSATL